MNMAKLRKCSRRVLQADHISNGANMKLQGKTAWVIGRSGNPQEVANVVLFLASEDARCVTGSSYFVDVGLMCNIDGAWPGCPQWLPFTQASIRPRWVKRRLG